MSDISKKTNLQRIFADFSKTLLFCRLRKIAQIREKSGEISNAISLTLSNFRNQFRRELRNFEESFEISKTVSKRTLKIRRLLRNLKVRFDPKIVTAALRIVLICELITFTADSYSRYSAQEMIETENILCI